MDNLAPLACALIEMTTARWYPYCSLLVVSDKAHEVAEAVMASDDPVAHLSAGSFFTHNRDDAAAAGYPVALN